MMKNFSLNKVSWHTTYYQAVFGKGLPKTLCPYFWKMILILFLSPIILPILGIGKLVDLYLKWSSKHPRTPKPVKPYNKERHNKWERIWEIIGKIIFIVLITLFVGLVLFAMFMGAQKDGWMFFVYLLAFIGGITVLVGLIWLIISTEIVEKIVDSSIVQIPCEMIKAWYTKSCPIVDWVDKKTPVVSEPIIIDPENGETKND